LVEQAAEYLVAHRGAGQGDYVDIEGQRARQPRDLGLGVCWGGGRLLEGLLWARA
jgi:hypothetical protein